MTAGPLSPTATEHAPVVPPHWAAALTRVRDEVNPAIGAVTAGGVPLEAVTAALRRIGPSFEQHCSRVPLAAQDRWASALARAAVRALAARQWSDRSVVPWTVTELLPRLAVHLADLDSPAEVAATAGDPHRGDLVAELVHAAGEVWRHGDVALWGRLLLAGAESPHARGGRESLTTMEIRDIGVVAAWRAGHVRMRSAAHRVGPGLRDDRLARALDLGDGALAREALAANALEPASWLPDETAPNVGGDTALRTIGGCAGFGGPFRAPPVIVSGDGLRWRLREHRRDGRQVGGPGQQRDWDLMVDVHGAWLAPATGPDGPGPHATAPDAPTVRLGRMPTGDQSPEVGRTAYGRSVLVTSPQSHVVVHVRTAS
ncbi:hypothetical protein [Lapillicoccus sp.]|uniref:hypothetical protein n=1 Tax=Lapillicoccus sp. TaxID=1909287 RepID=UPI0025D6492F|nr:hypothetical protein [Lapillicoccus sp.]